MVTIAYVPIIACENMLYFGSMAYALAELTSGTRQCCRCRRYVKPLKYACGVGGVALQVCAVVNGANVVNQEHPNTLLGRDAYVSPGY